MKRQNQADIATERSRGGIMQLHGFGGGAFGGRQSSFGLGDGTATAGGGGNSSSGNLCLEELNAVMKELHSTEQYVGSSACLRQMALQRLTERRLAEKRRRQSQENSDGEWGKEGEGHDSGVHMAERLASLVGRLSRNSHVENLGGGKPWELHGPTPPGSADRTRSASRGSRGSRMGRRSTRRGTDSSLSDQSQMVIRKRMSVTVPAFDLPDDPAFDDSEDDDDAGEKERKPERSLSNAFLGVGGGGDRRNQPLMLGSLLSRASAVPGDHTGRADGNGGEGGWQGRAMGFLRRNGGGSKDSLPSLQDHEESGQEQEAASEQQHQLFLADDYVGFGNNKREEDEPSDASDGASTEAVQLHNVPNYYQAAAPLRRRRSSLLSLAESSIGSLDDADLAAIQRTAARCGGLAIHAADDDSCSPSPASASHPGSRRQSAVRRRSTGAAGDKVLTATERAAEEEAALHLAEFHATMSRLEESLRALDTSDSGAIGRNEGNRAAALSLPSSSGNDDDVTPAARPSTVFAPLANKASQGGVQSRRGSRRSSLTRPRGSILARRGTLDSMALRSIQEGLSDFDDDYDDEDERNKQMHAQEEKKEEAELSLEDVFGIDRVMGRGGDGGGSADGRSCDYPTSEEGSRRRLSLDGSCQTLLVGWGERYDGDESSSNGISSSSGRTENGSSNGTGRGGSRRRSVIRRGSVDSVLSQLSQDSEFFHQGKAHDSLLLKWDAQDSESSCCMEMGDLVQEGGRAPDASTSGYTSTENDDEGTVSSLLVGFRRRASILPDDEEEGDKSRVGGGSARCGNDNSSGAISEAALGTLSKRKRAGPGSWFRRANTK